LQRAEADLRQRSIRALSIRCDITARSDVLRMFAQIHSDERFGAVDILVNNAGVIEVGPAESMLLADFEEAMRTHFWGPLYTILAALPRMKAQRQGRIVNVSSIGGKIAVPHLLPYSASKFALVGLSEGLRAELSKDGICVTTVCPGLMTTGSPRNATFKGQHAKEYAWFSASDAMPFVAMKSQRAAKKIVEACKRGDSELILTPQAKLAVMLNGLIPGLIPDAMRMVNAVLPANGPAGVVRKKGRETASFKASSVLTIRDEAAAQRNNEAA
jgi:NAD(P)-dependent dehydrogenase (short-subunit alcohol dehydrogenase family)